MFRKVLILCISLLSLSSVVGCDNTADDKTSESTTQIGSSELITGENFAAAPFSDIAEGDFLSDEDMKALIESIPRDKYETYPDTHNVPVSATLYKNGETVSISADDERLIRLINFFNNCVYYAKCAYIQSFLSVDYIEENVTDCDFRLELTYVPYGETGPSPYGTCTTMCDTIIITDDFTLMAHNLPGYEGEREKYPFRAVSFSPLYDAYNWLELFGF